MAEMNKKDQMLYDYCIRRITEIEENQTDIREIRERLYLDYIGDKQTIPSPIGRGKSDYISRDMLETIEWAKPAIIKAILSSDTVVNYKAMNEKDTSLAKLESKVVNYYALHNRHTDGYVAISDAIFACLIYPTVYIKAMIEEVESETRMQHDLLQQQVEELYNDEYIQVLEVMRQPNSGLDFNGQPLDLFSVEYEQYPEKPKLKLEYIDPDDVLVPMGWTKTSLVGCDFVGHREMITGSDLYKMGFDPDDYELYGGEYDVSQLDSLYPEKRYGDELDNIEYEESNKPLMKYKVYEITCDYDYDDDKIAERIKVLICENSLLEVVPMSYMSLIGLSCIRMPGEHTGMSLGQKVQDIQYRQSINYRNLQDNIYQLNNNRKVLSMDSITKDNSTLTAIQHNLSPYIPVRGSARDALMPEVRPSIIGDTLAVIQDTTKLTPRRTGVTAEFGLNPQNLQRTAQEAFTEAHESSTDIIDLMIKTIAETGLTDLFDTIHQILRENPIMINALQLDDGWHPVNTNDWGINRDSTVNVGLGVNSKSKMSAMLFQLLDLQMRLIEGGSRIVTEQNVHDTIVKLLEISGLDDPDKHVTDPRILGPPPEPEPDPMMEKNLQMMDHSMAAMDRAHNLEMQNAIREHQIEMAKLQEATTKREEENKLKMIDLENKYLDVLGKIDKIEAEAVKAKLDDPNKRD